LYVDNIEKLSQANIVGNRAGNYLWFDAKTFVVEPFTDPYDDRFGRQFFWNYLGKTGLYGEFNYRPVLSRNAASCGSFLVICLFVYSLAGLSFMKKKEFEFTLVPLLSGVFLLGGVTYMRMTFPANIDFRYVLPILISTSLLSGVALAVFQRMQLRKLVWIGWFFNCAFVVSSVVFFLGLFIE